MICKWPKNRIQRTDPYRHKYNDAMAEFLHGDMPDRETGSVDFGCWVGQYGKRLLEEDDQGFVNCYRFPTEQAATDRFDKIEREYCGWEEGDEPL